MPEISIIPWPLLLNHYRVSFPCKVGVDSLGDNFYSYYTLQVADRDRRGESMKRRDFFRAGTVAGAGALLLPAA